MSRWALRLLGSGGLARSGEAECALPEGALELFAFVATRDALRSTRASIVAALWPDQEEESGRSRLATLLWRLRNVTGKTVCPIEVSGEHLTLSRAIWVDSLAFQKHARPFGKLQRTCNTPALAKLRAAVRVYGGEFLPGLDSEWVKLERTRLHYLYLDTLYALAFAEAAADNWSDVVVVARHLCEAEPLREDAHRLLIQAYARTGNRGLAIRQFKLCTQVLRQELAVDPMPETIALYECVQGLPPGLVAQPADGQIANLLISARSTLDLALRLSGVSDLNF